MELAASVVAVVLLSGCGEDRGADTASPAPSGSNATSSSALPAGDVATWALPQDELVNPTLASLVLEVTRLGCSGGITGTVLDPQIEYEGARVLIRTDVEKLGPGAYTCPGNDAVTIEVILDEPLGVRQLIDAACLDGEAVDTAACPSTVRWAPPEGLARHDGMPNWQAPPSYSFVVQSSCGERAFIGEYAVTVEEGSVVDVDALRRGWDDIELGSVPSIADMLDLARQAQRDGDAEVWVDQEGTPRWFALDPVLGSVDDENCFLVTRYEQN